MTAGGAEFAHRVVRWQAVHGRNDLPWQNTRDPYRVWLSEVMLQQTQVATVRAYFDRFLARFPDVSALAAASLDEVFGLWSGLGYYARARNLHQCAVAVVAQWGGQFPTTAQDLVSLPGIGRSTAAAIASLCFGERVAILDANVKRVVARVLAFGADLAHSAHERQLWDAATELLPRRDLARAMPRYTQGMMDLGATVCLLHRPSCMVCPVNDLCLARSQGRPEAYPVRTRKLKRSAHSAWLLWAQNDQRSVWLQKRPARGIWAGLYCLPWFDSRESLLAALAPDARAGACDLAGVKHVLTHKDLHLHPVRVDVPGEPAQDATGRWFGRDAWPQLGLPAPVRRLLLQA